MKQAREDVPRGRCDEGDACDLPATSRSSDGDELEELDRYVTNRTGMSLNSAHPQGGNAISAARQGSRRLVVQGARARATSTSATQAFSLEHHGESAVDRDGAGALRRDERSAATDPRTVAWSRAALVRVDHRQHRVWCRPSPRTTASGRSGCGSGGGSLAGCHGVGLALQRPRPLGEALHSQLVRGRERLVQQLQRRSRSPGWRARAACEAKSYWVWATSGHARMPGR